MQRQRAYVGGNLQPGAALFVVRLSVGTLPPGYTAQAVAGCRLVGWGVVSGRPLRSRAVAGVSQRVRVGLGPVLASRAPCGRRGRLAGAGLGSHCGVEFGRSRTG